MPYKFEQLDVWNLSLEYIDTIYGLAEKLPKSEEYNLKSQIIRAATSISLNIAEGSTGQRDAEQARFFRKAIRSLIETVACHILFDEEAIFKKKTFYRKPIKPRSYSQEKFKLFERLYPTRNAKFEKIHLPMERMT